MPDVIEQYIRANDNADDYAEYLLSQMQQDALEDIDDMMHSLDGRDEQLWEAMDVDASLTVDDYENRQPEERSLEWVTGLAGLAAAAGTQFLLDNRDDTIIRPVAYREQVLADFDLTRAQLVQAGKRKLRTPPTVRFVRLQDTYINELRALRVLENRALYDTLLDYGALRPPDQVVADASGYVARMTQYKPGTPQFKSAVNDLIDMESGRGLKQQVRRSVERVYSYREADGNLDTLMVWIGEGDKSTCDFCPLRYGVIKRFGDWLEDGMPGAEVCAGGDYCRCHLAAV
jgi:hypothetical protein